MILPEDPEKAEVERAWQERGGEEQHQRLSTRPSSILSYNSTPGFHSGGLPLPPPPYYNPNPSHASVGPFSADDVADSANVGMPGRRSSPARRSRSRSGSFSSSLEEAEDQRRHQSSDPYARLRRRSQNPPQGFSSSDGNLGVEMTSVSPHNDQEFNYPSTSSAGFNTGAILLASADEHRGFLAPSSSQREDSAVGSATIVASPADTERANKRRPRNKEWIAEPDVDAHQAVPKWNGQISDLLRWMYAHSAATVTTFRHGKWKRWNKKKWAMFWAIVLLLVGGVVGGIFGGLDIAQNSKSTKLRMPPGPDGSRVVVPWESSAALVFDPLKVRSHTDRVVSNVCLNLSCSARMGPRQATAQPRNAIHSRICLTTISCEACRSPQLDSINQSPPLPSIRTLLPCSFTQKEMHQPEWPRSSGQMIGL